MKLDCLWNGLSSSTRANIAKHEKTLKVKTVNLLAYAYAGSNPALPSLRLRALALQARVANRVTTP